MVHLLDRDTNFFKIVAGVLQGDTSATYLFIICQDDVLQTFDRSNKRKCLYAKKKKKKKKKAISRQYLPVTIKDADYTDDLVLLANTPAQAKSLLHSLQLPCEWK